MFSLKPSKTLASVLFAAIASAAVMTAATIPIPGLCNTGVVGPCNGGPGTALRTVGLADLNWQLALPSPSSPSATPITPAILAGLTFGPNSAFVNTPNGVWLANGPNSEWITPMVEGGPGGYYVYQTTFTIPTGFVLSSAMISGMFTSDNEGSSVFLNGNLVTSGVVFPGPADFGSFTGSFTLNSSNATFQSGLNKLDFVVRNRGVGGIDGNPTDTGLRVEFNSALSTVSTPEPGSMPLIASALIGLGVAWRQRRRKLIPPGV